MKPPAFNANALIIDPDRMSAKLAAVILQAAGVSPHVAWSAQDALRALDSVRPRLVVIDLELEDLSALTIVRLLRQADWAKSTRIIATTSGNGARKRIDALAAGCHAYLVKPIDSDVLISTTATLLEGNPT